MSSRPRGWSEDGAEVMVKLLRLKYNGLNLREVYLDKICKRESKVKKAEGVLSEIMKENVNRVKKQVEDTRNNIPILECGKVNLLYRVLKALSSGDFLNAVGF